MLHRFIVCATLVAAFSGRAAADVIVVGPGQAFTTIQDGVDAASDGDVVLVKSGSYGPVIVDAKAVTIVADLNGSMVIVGGVQVVNLPANRTVLLDKLTSWGSWDTGTVHGLHVKDCAGRVFVQRGEYHGAYGPAVLDVEDCNVVGHTAGSIGALIENCQSVAFTAAQVWGGPGATVWDDDCRFFTFMIGGPGGDGLDAIDSRVTVYDTLIVGGDSGTGGYADDAGHGVVANGHSSLVLANVHAMGGIGGDSKDGFVPTLGGLGGSALSVGSDSQARLLDCDLESGYQGSGFGLPGGLYAPITSGSGLVVTFSGTAKPLTVNGLLREGQTTTVKVTGDPGESVLLYVSFGASGFAVPKAKGVFLLSPATLLSPLALGTLVTSSLSVSFTIPQLPAGIDAAEVWLQGLVSGQSGLTLASWGHMTLLDSTY